MNLFKLLVVSAIILFISSHVNAADVSGGVTNLVVDEKVTVKVKAQ